MFSKILLLLFFSPSLEARPVPIDLPTVQIEDSPLAAAYPRSVLWPSSMETLPERRLSPDFSDTLNSTGQLQVRSQGSPTISIRGSGQSGRVLSLFNDVPLNFSSGFGTPEVLLPKEIVGDINVVKGPSSIFYGSQALGGSVHFRPQWTKTPELRVYASDTDSSFLPGKEGGLANTNLALVLPLARSARAQHQASIFREANDGRFDYKINGQTGVRNNNKSQTTRGTLLGEHDFGAVDLMYSLIAGETQRTSPGPVNFPLITEEDTQGQLLSLGPRWQLSPKTFVSGKIHHINLKSDFESAGSPSQFQQTTTIQQTDFQWTSSHLKVRVFADAFQHKLSSSFFSEDYQEDIFEAGPLLTYYISPEFYVLGGSRYLFRDEQALNNAGLFFDTGRHLSWIQYSEGFRRPSLTDKFSETPFSLANPDLQPERSRQVELGYRLEPKTNLITTYQWQFSGEVRAFAVHYDNFFEARQATPTQIQKVNRGEGTSRGLDTKVNLAWGPWGFDMSYNFLQTENRSLNDEAFRLSPEHQFSGSLTHYIGPFGIQLQNVVWQKTFDRDLSGDLQPLPDWSQWNLEFFSYGFTKFNFHIGITNMFDVGKQLTLNYPEPQKRYWAQVRYAF